jgi:hypothetical protein
MSWGPEDNADMWTRKRERLTSSEFARLRYGPYRRLVVEQSPDNKWSWVEMDNKNTVLTITNKKFDSFLEAVKNYEEKHNESNTIRQTS